MLFFALRGKARKKVLRREGAAVRCGEWIQRFHCLTNLLEIWQRAGQVFEILRGVVRKGATPRIFAVPDGYTPQKRIPNAADRPIIRMGEGVFLRSAFQAAWKRSSRSSTQTARRSQ